MPKLICLLAVTGLFFGITLPLAAQYPVKPITLIVPFAAGGPADTGARAIAVPMSKQLNQTVIVHNLGGAAGSVGAQHVARAAPDGYTVLWTNTAMAIAPAIDSKLAYNPLTDFEYIGLAWFGSMAIIAPSDFPPGNLQELVGYLRINKDKLSFGNTGIGGPSHLCELLFMNATQINLLTVPYKSTSLAMTDLFGGRIDLLCDSVATAAPHIRSGKVKAYGVTTQVRIPVVPEVPTLHEQGLKGFELTTWTGLYAPKNTPKQVIDKLTQALQGALRASDLKAYFANSASLPASSEQATPRGLQAHLASEIQKFSDLIKKAGIKPD